MGRSQERWLIIVLVPTCIGTLNPFAQFAFGFGIPADRQTTFDPGWIGVARPAEAEPHFNIWPDLLGNGCVVLKMLLEFSHVHSLELCVLKILRLHSDQFDEWPVWKRCGLKVGEQALGL